jgi:hypothetical protein
VRRELFLPRDAETRKVFSVDPHYPQDFWRGGSQDLRGNDDPVMSAIPNRGKRGFLSSIREQHLDERRHAAELP